MYSSGLRPILLRRFDCMEGGFPGGWGRECGVVQKKETDYRILFAIVVFSE